MRRHRRRRGSAGHGTPVVPPPVPPAPPFDVTTEVEMIIDARDNLEVAISTFDVHHHDEQAALLRSFARDLRVPPIDPNVALTKSDVWNTSEELAQKQLHALNQLLDLLRERAEALKADAPAEALIALRRIIERLTADRNRPGADVHALDARIEKLREEAEALEYPAQAAEPRAKKRPAKSKSQRHEADDN